MSDKKYTTVDGANTLITTYHLANKYGIYKIFCDQWMTEDKEICFWTICQSSCELYSPIVLSRYESVESLLPIG